MEYDFNERWGTLSNRNLALCNLLPKGYWKHPCSFVFYSSSILHKDLLNLSPARDATVYGWENPSASAHWSPGCSYYSLPHWLVWSGYNVCVLGVCAAVLWLACDLPCETALGDVSVLIPHLSRGCFLCGYTGSCLWVTRYRNALTKSLYNLRKVSAKSVFRFVICSSYNCCIVLWRCIH